MKRQLRTMFPDAYPEAPSHTMVDPETYPKVVVPSEKPKADRGIRPSKVGYLYLISAGGLHKIGMSAQPKQRFRDITHNLSVFGIEARLVHVWAVRSMPDAEREMHEKYADKRVKLEWFCLSPEDVSDICKLRGWYNQ